MPSLTWTDGLELGLSFMDDTHREFVDLLAQCEQAADAALPALWNALVAHTEDHFGREDDWMRATGFAAANCHSMQHRMVLQVLREAAARADAGDPGPVRQLIGELAVWFPQHAQTMDAALGLHLRGVGYDATSGAVLAPELLPAREITGCGGAACSPAAAEPPAHRRWRQAEIPAEAHCCPGPVGSGIARGSVIPAKSLPPRRRGREPRALKTRRARRARTPESPGSPPARG